MKSLKFIPCCILDLGLHFNIDLGEVWRNLERDDGLLVAILRVTDHVGGLAIVL